jgi:hypothetical protein
MTLSPSEPMLREQIELKNEEEAVDQPRSVSCVLAFGLVSLFALVTPVGGQGCPELLSSLECQEEYSLAIAVSEGFAYVSTWNETSGEHGLRVVDVRSSSDLVEVGYLPLSQCGGPPIIVSGRYAYLACYDQGPSPTDTLIIDVSDPNSPVEVGVMGGFGSVSEIANGYAYTLTPDRVRVLDITDPISPVEVGAFSYDYRYSFGQLAVSGDLLYVTSIRDESPHLAFLLIIDASDPTNLRTIGSVEVMNSFSYRPRLGAVSGDLAFVVVPGMFGSGVRIVDVSDPSDPAVVEGGGLRGGSIVSAGHLVFIASDDYPTGGYSMVEVFDVSDPSAVARLGSYIYDGGRLHFWDSTLYARRLYVAAQGGACGLVVFDTSGCIHSPYERDFGIALDE